MYRKMALPAMGILFCAIAGFAQITSAVSKET